MGLSPFKASSCSCDVPAVTPKADGNPNPQRFKILWTAEQPGWVLAVIEYPDAKNFEGKKVLVYRGITAAELRAQKVLDPHFCEKGHVSPFARFEPSEAGIAAAKRLCEVLDG